MTPPILRRRALNRAALARQLLLGREPAGVVAALERIGGMQAQLARPPFIGLWSRLEEFRREQLTAAAEARQVVRATMMRATIHLVSSRDYLAWRPALQPALTAALQSVLRARVDALDVGAIVRAARTYFSRQPRTFAELREHLKSRHPDLDERAMGYAVRLVLPLVQTPTAGAEWGYPGAAAFTAAESWLGVRLAETGPLDPLLARYLAAFGPASRQDFQTWSGAAMPASAVDRLRPGLLVFRDERGRELLDVPDAPRPDPDEPAPAVRFLPEFDSLLLAYADRSRIIADEHRPLMATKNLFVPAVVLVDGVAAGKWSIERTRGVATLDVEPFVPLSRAVRRALTEEGETLLRFAEPGARDVSVRIAARAV